MYAVLHVDFIEDQLFLLIFHTFENPKKPLDFLTMSSLVTCSSLCTTRSKWEAAQKPVPMAHPYTWIGEGVIKYQVSG